MRRHSGQGSDTDRTDETLREGENAARKRGGDDDGVLLGLILLQRGLPAGLGLKLATARGLMLPSYGAAVMMRVMIADPRSARGSRGVKRDARADGGPIGNALIMVPMMVMMVVIIKNHALGGGPMLSRGNGVEVGVRMLTAAMMGPMSHKNFTIGGDGRRRRGASGLMVRMVALLGNARGSGLLAA